MFCGAQTNVTIASLYVLFFASICLCCQWLTVAPHYSIALYHASKDTVVSLLPRSHLDACRYSLCQVMLAASFVSRESSSSSPQPRNGIHNYSQRPSLANAFPPPGVSTYSRHCDALEDSGKAFERQKVPSKSQLSHGLIHPCWETSQIIFTIWLLLLINKRISKQINL